MIYVANVKSEFMVFCLECAYINSRNCAMAAIIFKIIISISYKSPALNKNVLKLYQKALPVYMEIENTEKAQFIRHNIMKPEAVFDRE